MNRAGCILLLVFSVFISACSQVLLKKSTEHAYPSRWKEFFCPKTLGAYASFLLATLLGTVSFRALDVSFATALEGLGYFFVLMLGSLFLNESMTRRKWLALALMLVGLAIYGRQS